MCEVNLPPSSADVQDQWSHKSTPSVLLCVAHKDNFTLTFYPNLVFKYSADSLFSNTARLPQCNDRHTGWITGDSGSITIVSRDFSFSFVHICLGIHTAIYKIGTGGFLLGNTAAGTVKLYAHLRPRAEMKICRLVLFPMSS